jgi:FixJ family two-component response regulator
MDGVALQRELSKKSIDLPVIIVTAYGDQPIAQDAVEGGAAAVISKPFHVDELIETIRKTLPAPP